jgi:hypothetical protein
VTKQIATNLQTAAQTATKDGDTSAASQLTQLATDFTKASSSGQLPNIQDLVAAVGGGHAHHHHASASTSAAGTSTTPSAEQQLLAAFQSGTNSQSGAFNPLSIISNMLSSAGITGS